MFRGVPKNLGCIKLIIDWLPPILNAFGAITLVVTALEVLVLVFAISLLCYKKKNDEVQLANV